MNKHLYQQIYERAGYSEEHALQLSDIARVIKSVNDRLAREGKTTLIQYLREMRKGA